jgi:hypothetical protein
MLNLREAAKALGLGKRRVGAAVKLLKLGRVAGQELLLTAGELRKLRRYFKKPRGDHVQ